MKKLLVIIFFLTNLICFSQNVYFKPLESNIPIHTDTIPFLSFEELSDTIPVYIQLSLKPEIEQLKFKTVIRLVYYIEGYKIIGYHGFVKFLDKYKQELPNSYIIWQVIRKDN